MAVKCNSSCRIASREDQQGRRPFDKEEWKKLFNGVQVRSKIEEKTLSRDLKLLDRRLKIWLPFPELEYVFFLLVGKFNTSQHFTGLRIQIYG